MPQATSLIYVPFAHDDKIRSGENVTKDVKKRFNVYMKNLCVALVSIKKFNQNCDVALITNIENDDIPDEFKNILLREKILIYKFPFDEFRFPDNYAWGLAFYKLCAMSHILKETEYKKFCYLDTDVYAQGSFDNIWRELDENILLYDINHGLGVPHYLDLVSDLSKFYGHKKLITHYGGEFFASNRENAQEFLSSLEKIFKVILKKNLFFKSGDEYLLSIAADEMKNKIKNAGAYVFRFWTYHFFRLVSTCYKSNPVVVLHMPSEKERGILKIYDKYIKPGKNLPENEIIWKICGLNGRPVHDGVKILLSKIKAFIKKFKCYNPSRDKK